ncbi:unnamed protein product [Microthlaspi erraticum]|uniref:Integrase catalytic domain-containing protein n=1 Tax=Microthlaspi erraticum TaxID=1685480 RepID=A0A6D2ID54_9BRAS|nr:unnamed protein product [Microthlaspi erraticum]
MVAGEVPNDFDAYKRKKFFKDARHYYWDESNLYRRGPYSIYRRCIAEEDVQGVLEHCHGSAYGGHFATFKPANKVLQAELWLPTLFKNETSFSSRCDPCQRKGVITKKNKMPQNPILEIEIFDWIEAIACPAYDAKVVVKLFKTIIFPRYGIPKVVISDGGSHFINKVFEKLMKNYGVKHKVATPYHPQTSGQVEVSNRQVKAILEKTVSFTRKDLATRLDEALWAYRTAYKTPIGRSPFNLLYGKACHLPVEIEYKALWAIKMLNFDMKTAHEKKVMDLHEFEEIRLDAYENSKIYKERTKAANDKLIRLKDFKAWDSVLFVQFEVEAVSRKAEIKMVRTIQNP